MLRKRGSGLVCIKQIPEALALPLPGLGLPTSGPPHLQSDCVLCLSKSLVWSAVVASAFHCGRVIPSSHDESFPGLEFMWELG